MSPSAVQPRVGYLMPEANASSYYRAYLPYRSLAAVPGDFDARLYARAGTAFADDVDVLVLRGFADEGMFEMTRRLRERGVRVVYDLDYHPEPPPYHPWRRAFDAQRPFLQLMLANCDLVTTHSEELRAHLRDHAEHVAVVGNHLGDAFFAPPDPLAAPGLGLPRRTLLVAWPGSPAHLPDLGVLRGALAEALERFPAARFMAFHKDAPAVAGVPAERSVVLPFKAYPSHMHVLRLADIVIAPAEDSAFGFTRSCPIALEAAALGVPVVGSPTPAHLTLAEEGVPVRLAEHAGQWTAELSRLLRDRETRRVLGAELSEAVQAKRRAAGRAGEYRAPISRLVGGASS